MTLNEDSKRWHAYHYGSGYDEWAVRERRSGGIKGDFPSILTWLTERQAHAIAEVLNDMCGYNWCDNHPDWCEEMKRLRGD